MATTSVFQYRYPLSSSTVNVPQDIQNLATDIDYVNSIMANKDTFSAIGTAGLAASTSGSYVDITGTTKTFTKIGAAADSDLIISGVSVSGFVSVGNTEFAVGVNVNGTDRDVTKLNFNAANQHTPLPPGHVRITGLAAGTITIKVRAKRNSGTGTLTVDTGDCVSFVVEERAI